MPTIHATRDPGTATADLVTLTGLRLRRHLQHLLEVRDKLAVLSTERFSHNLDDDAETFALMIGVEDEIAALFPEVHNKLFATWITTVAKASHEPGDYNPHCGICRGTQQPDLPKAA